MPVAGLFVTCSADRLLALVWLDGVLRPIGTPLGSYARTPAWLLGRSKARAVRQQ